MKALSLTQPWASLVIEGYQTGEAHKEYETRSWSTSFRGPLAIHASKGFPRWAQAFLGTYDDGGETFFRDVLNRDPRDMPRGAIIGVVALVGCQPTDAVLASETVFVSLQEYAFGDWGKGRYAWKFVKPVWFQKPIPAAGSLGLWTISDETMPEVVSQWDLQRKINPQP